MSFSHRRSCSLSKSSGRNSNWGKLSSHLKTILLCNLLDQIVHLEERDFSIEDLVWLRIHLAGRSSGSCGSCHGPFHHTCVNIQVFEGFLKLIHHLGKGSGNIFVHMGTWASTFTPLWSFPAPWSWPPSPKLSSLSPYSLPLPGKLYFTFTTNRQTGTWKGCIFRVHCALPSW